KTRTKKSSNDLTSIGPSSATPNETITRQKKQPNNNHNNNHNNNQGRQIMDFRSIRKLVELVKNTGIGEIEVKTGEDSVRICCNPMPAQPGMQVPQVAAAPYAQPVPGGPLPAGNPAQEVRSQEEPIEQGHNVASPMVGTVYIAPTPGAKPFVKVGQHVNEGDTICLIEAMKMFNQIEADCSGVISACMVNNEQPVEFDQTLFVITPDDE
ncbi:MAG: acetyl-CoA carboxylase biotin carboxyl carrier protein, partial [Paracoccaceae bacterium]